MPSRYGERNAARLAEANAKAKAAYQPMTIDRLRQSDPRLATLTDEEVVAHWQRAGQVIAAQKAKRDDEALAWWEADQAKKAQAVASRSHRVRLADADTRATTYLDRAERAERKADGLEAQLDGLWKGQGRH
jgi:hypothetical protein